MILSKLATMIMDADFKEALIKAKSKEEFLKLIDDKEDGKFQAPASAAVELSKEAADHIQILAVTACPTGIAHTFMAAESLEQHAKKRGISIKVETNGSGGAKNVLTADEIAKADGIIVAADKNVAMARFDGKHVVITKVADGINKADELIDKALSGSAPIYHAKAGESAGDSGGSVENESLGRQVYKHLMNGVSHMLPFVVGGGILIAISFLLDDYSIDPSHFGSNTPVAAFFNKVGGASVENESIGRQVYKHLMNGVSHMLPFVVGGGILIAISFLLDDYLGALVAGFLAGFIVNWLKKALSGLPASLEGTKPILLYPLLGVLAIGFICTLVIGPPIAAVNEWLIDTLKNMDQSAKMLIGALVGGMMAIDMGGPINKAAYVTGTGLVNLELWRLLWLAVWFLRSRLLLLLSSSKTNSHLAKDKLALPTLLWDFHSLLKVQFLSRQVTRSM